MRARIAVIVAYSWGFWMAYMIGEAKGLNLAIRAFEREDHAHELLRDLIPMAEQALFEVARTDLLVAGRMAQQVPWWRGRMVVFGEIAP